VAIEKVTSLF